MSERVADPPSPYAGYVSYSDYSRLAARVAELEAREKKLREKILRVRDWLKYEANADGGICSEIDAAARAEVDKP